jgi:hypothetical protein
VTFVCWLLLHVFVMLTVSNLPVRTPTFTGIRPIWQLSRERVRRDRDLRIRRRPTHSVDSIAGSATRIVCSSLRGSDREYGQVMSEPVATGSQMVVVTPTYAPDLELFGDLHQSVLRWFPADVRHIVVVNEPDLPLFRRCEVVGVRDVLPASVVALPFTKLWCNVRRPVPPLRGWILQQLVKLAVVEQTSARTVVLADSDLVFIRPVTADIFAPDGRVRLYRMNDGVDDSLHRHVKWHAVAHELLGLPPPERPPLPDYVSSLNTWDRDVVNRMLRRIEKVTGQRRWLEAVGKELHFSEWTLYGVYADQAERAEHVTLASESLCHSYWDAVPLSEEKAASWLSAAGADDVAYMVSAKSHTPLSIRRAAHASVFAS